MFRTEALTIALVLGACSGQIPSSGEDPPAARPPESPPSVDPGASAPPGVTLPPGKTYKPLQPTSATMQRLTATQYLNTIADVFGPGVKPASPLEDDERTELFLSIGAAQVGTSPLGVEQYQRAALSIADQILRDRSKHPWLASCTPDRADDPCIGRAIETIGLRLWRRPLTAEEVQRYARIAGADGSGRDKMDAGLRYALAALLQSPHFLYVVRVGEEEPGTGARRLTGYELASRLSYFLWDSTPDVALLEAARTGKLSTKEGLDAEIARMLGEPRARSLPSRFFAEFWKVARLAEDSKNTSVYPLWTPALLASYRRELELVIDDLVFGRDGDVRELFDGRHTMADGALAKLYGMTGGGGTFAKLTLPETRTGLITSGAVISANSPQDRTSPTHRGVFLLERVLCKHVPPPPPNVNDTLPEQPMGAQRKSIRELLEEHRANPVCAGCHGLFDPIGLTFESFDGIGVHRTNDAGKPIDPTGELEGRTYKNVRELAAFLRGDPRPAHCMAEHLYAFATGHEPTDGEEGVVDALADLLAGNGHKLQGLVRAVAASPGFRLFTTQN